jgi:hypothetical protein
MLKEKKKIISLRLKLKTALLKILRFPKNRKIQHSQKFEISNNTENSEDWFPHESF